MKEKNIIRLIAFLSLFGLLVYITNFTIVHHFIRRYHSFSNYNGTYMITEPHKGSIYVSSQERLKYYQSNHPEAKDKQLYRRFRMDLWRFWEWGELWYHPDRYDLPFISEKEINENRKEEELPPIVFD